MLHAERGCAAHGPNLGKHFASPHACLAAAHTTAGCSDAVMFSQRYNYVWGCRCCAPGGTDGGHANKNWAVWASDKLPSAAEQRAEAMEAAAQHGGKRLKQQQRQQQQQALTPGQQQQEMKQQQKA